MPEATLERRREARQTEVMVDSEQEGRKPKPPPPPPPPDYDEKAGLPGPKRPPKPTR